MLFDIHNVRFIAQNILYLEYLSTQIYLQEKLDIWTLRHSANLHVHVLSRLLTDGYSYVLNDFFFVSIFL